MSDKIRVGLVGTGRIGKLHTQTLVQRVATAQLAAVTDAMMDSARAVGAQYGVPVMDSYEQILADDSIKAVVICSSTDTHAPFIIKAAEAGKHIFCEKPIAADLKVIDEALAAVDKAGVKLMVGFNRRFDPNFMRVREAIVNKEIGNPHLMHIISRDPAPPPISYIKVSGGLFFDMTIHDFDMARFLLGEVTEVYTAAGVMVDPAIGEAGDIDTAMITLKFANGAIGVIDNSRQAVYGYDQRVEVFGSGGSISTDNVYHNQATVRGADKVYTGSLPMNFFMDRYVPAYQAELETFIDCVVNDKDVPVNGQDGRAPVVIAMAAMKSLAENRPVRVDEISG